MTEEVALSALRTRAIEVPLHGKRLDSVMDCDTGPVGLFTPPSPVHGEVAIRLRRGRGPRKTLLTLCHELGHFWSYASELRTMAYERALFQLAAWESSVSSAIRNADAVQRFGGLSTAPDELVGRVRAIVLREKPCPLTAEAQQEVILEEGRAWWFGAEIAARCAPEASATLAVEASAALGFYYDRFGIQAASWTSSAFERHLGVDDQAYLVRMTA